MCGKRGQIYKFVFFPFTSLTETHLYWLPCVLFSLRGIVSIHCPFVGSELLRLTCRRTTCVCVCLCLPVLVVLVCLRPLFLLLLLLDHQFSRRRTSCETPKHTIYDREKRTTRRVTFLCYWCCVRVGVWFMRTAISEPRGLILDGRG